LQDIPMRIRSSIVSFNRTLKILLLMFLFLALGGCINRDSEQGTENNSENSVSELNMSAPNMVRLVVFRAKNETLSDVLPIRLEVKNPSLNETVLTVFKPQLGLEWYNQTNITEIVDDTWSQNFTIKRKGDISYIQMFVQISDNNTVVRRAAWNITLEAPLERP
jgi:hypothetical protein